MNSFRDYFWLLVRSFFFVMYLIVLFHMIGDLFRNKSLSGWVKTLVGQLFDRGAFLAALTYLVTRGRHMSKRQAEQMEVARAATGAAR